MLSAKNIKARKICFDEYRLISQDAFDHEDKRTNITPGDVLLTIVGAIGRTAIALESHQKFTLQRSVAVLKPGAIASKYLSYLLESPEAQSFFENNAKGTAQKGVYLKTLGGMKVPVAPAAEQARIAQVLDGLLAQVDTLKARLDALPALIKRFRQSVFSDAVSGALTNSWRERNPADVQDSSDQLGQLIEEMRNGLSTKPNESSQGVPILRISAVRSGSVDQTDIRFLECDEVEKRRYAIKKGDLLFTRYNGSLDFVGVCGLVKKASHEIIVYPDKIIRVRCKTDIILPEYLEIFFSECSTRQRVMNLVKSTSGQKGISGQDLKSLCVTYPGISEQLEVVRRVEQLFSFADQLEARLADARQRVDALTQSILAKAFRGELVPQDPNDEPASVLLERIAAQRAADPKPKRGRKAAAH
ncbi:MAG: restriction endonuclease subunit S [Stenotrophomonas sp.]|nr:MAG: restriction endonuclease subunit S [Stenotrophomonas sp.]